MDEIEKNALMEQNGKQSPPFNASIGKRVDIGILLALFLGYFGAHHFYLGKWKMGIGYLILGLLTFLSIPLSLIDCFRMKGLVARANNTQSPSVGTMVTPQAVEPVTSGVPKSATLLGMPAKYAIGCAGLSGAFFVVIFVFGYISTINDLKGNQKEFEQNREEIVSVAQKALDGGDFNKAKSIGLKHKMSHDPELGKILTIANSKLAEKEKKQTNGKTVALPELRGFKITADEFVQRYNESLKTLKSDKRLRIGEEINNGKSITLTVVGEKAFGCILSANPDSRNLLSVTYLGSGDGTLRSGSAILLGLAAVVMAIENPKMIVEKRKKILESFGLLNGELEKKGKVKVVRGRVIFTLSLSETRTILIANPF